MESPLIVVACLVVAVVEFCKAHVIEEFPAFGDPVGVYRIRDID